MKVQVKTDVKIIFELDYEQAKALDAMAGYGADAFLKVFKEKLGEHYIRPYENGVRRLFDEIRGSGKPIQHGIWEVEKLDRTIRDINSGEYELRRKEKSDSPTVTK